MAKPLVAVVGRPNVGKSTLFNAIVNKRISIVEDIPGVTRDRIYFDAEWLNREFTMIDTGGIEFITENSHVIPKMMRLQAELAIEEADVILFVVDGKQGIVPADEEVANILRASGKPVVLVVNKIDSVNQELVDKVKKKFPDDELLGDLSDFFKVIGDGTRIRILWALDVTEMCVCDIAVLLNMTQSAISHQLRVLKQANLVKNRKEGKVVYYSLVDDHVREIFDQGLIHINEK